MRRGGQWAREGNVVTALLDQLLLDEYFGSSPPKSTGKDYFNLGWLNQFSVDDFSDQDIQATLVELTALTAAQAINQYGPNINEVFACGGGVKNQFLMERLTHFLEPKTLGLTSDLGVNCDACEAMAFAGLASRVKAGLPGNLPGVTGAVSHAVLGGFYPGRKTDPH